MAVPANDRKRQLMFPGGQFMTKTDISVEMVSRQAASFAHSPALSPYFSSHLTS
jgi:hypothetical protein